MTSIIDQSMKNVKVRTIVNDLWLNEREPYFGSELVAVPRPVHAGRGKKKMDKCKAKHRTDIKDDEWGKYNYYSSTSTPDGFGWNTGWEWYHPTTCAGVDPISGSNFINSTAGGGAAYAELSAAAARALVCCARRPR